MHLQSWPCLQNKGCSMQRQGCSMQRQGCSIQRKGIHCSARTVACITAKLPRIRYCVCMAKLNDGAKQVSCRPSCSKGNHCRDMTPHTIEATPYTRQDSKHTVNTFTWDRMCRSNSLFWAMSSTARAWRTSSSTLPARGLQHYPTQAVLRQQQHMQLPQNSVL